MSQGELLSAERERTANKTWLMLDQEFAGDRNIRRVTPGRTRENDGPTIRIVNKPRQPASLPQMFSEKAWAQIARSTGLSQRQMEIVQGVFRDDSEVDIADALGISPHTVHTHFERIYQKLGVTARTQLILRVVHEILSHTNPSALAARVAPIPLSAANGATPSVAIS